MAWQVGSLHTLWGVHGVPPGPEWPQRSKLTFTENALHLLTWPVLAVGPPLDSTLQLDCKASLSLLPTSTARWTGGYVYCLHLDGMSHSCVPLVSLFPTIRDLGVARGDLEVT